MKTATCHLVSTAPYSQSRRVTVKEKPKESKQDYEERTWRERCHTNADGHVVIPPMQFMNSVKEAAKYLSVQIPGKGKSTYTKNFTTSVRVQKPLVLPILKDDVPAEWVYVPADGVRGGTRRVDRCFPYIETWEGDVTFYILDDIITEDVFRLVLKCSGELIGIGRFRPINMGIYGTYKPTAIAWEEFDYGA